jgi:hypothetical protein
LLIVNDLLGEMKQPIYGLMADFDEPDQLLAAAHRAYEEGYRTMDAYSPFPIEGLAEAIGFHRNRVALIVLLMGIAGGLTGFFLQYYVAVIDYPLNIGGRPLNSWPSFVPIAFEVTVLFAAVSAVLGMLVLNRLPMPYHPVFNVPGFALATRNRFFLCIESADPKFDRAKTGEFLGSLGACEVSEVGW